MSLPTELTCGCADDGSAGSADDTDGVSAAGTGGHEHESEWRAGADAGEGSSSAGLGNPVPGPVPPAQGTICTLPSSSNNEFNPRRYALKKE